MSEVYEDSTADLISDLPDYILRLILSRLPSTEEVIRTRILSRRWRHVWTPIPSLDIDYSRGLKPSKKFKKRKFKKFVHWVVVNQSGNLDSFRLSCCNYYSMSTIGRWINAAVTKNVKILHLLFCPRQSKPIELPHCLATCTSLEELRLCLHDRRLILPKSTRFPALRVLELECVDLFDDDLVTELCKSCLSLEDLSIVDCETETKTPVNLSISCPQLKNLRIDNRNRFFCSVMCDTVSVISCPKLVSLEFGGHVAYHFFFQSLDYLKKVVFLPDDKLKEKYSSDTLRELFAGISHVESLSISHHFFKALHLPVSLPNLKKLELTIDTFISDKIVEFVKYFPNLTSLYLIIQQRFIISWKYGKLEDDETSRILTRHLKRVEFLDFNGEHTKLQLTEFLLGHGNALEEMVFSWSNEFMFHEMAIVTMKKVSEFHKVSSTVKLITLLRNDVQSFSNGYVSMLGSD